MVQKQFCFFSSLVFTIRKVLLLPLLLPLLLFAQCPTASFIIPDTVCPGEILTIINTSDSTATSFEWDFCGGDLINTPSIDSLTTITGALKPNAITTVYDGSNWFGFLSSRDNNKLFRLDFGNNLNNNPTLVPLGNPGGLLFGPKNIEIIKEDSIWYALVINVLNHKLIKLDFGNSLSNNSPAATDLTDLGGSLSVPRGMTLVQDNDSLIAIISSSGISKKITAVNFGYSINNSPDTVYNTIISDASTLMGLSVIKDCDKWYGIVLSFGNHKIYKLEFGETLFNKPTIVEITDSLLPINFTLPVNFPTEVHIVKDNGEFYAFVESRFNGLFRLDFGPTMANNKPKALDLNLSSDLNDIFGFNMAKQESEWLAFCIHATSHELFRLTFPDSCTANIATPTDSIPANIFYDQGGIYHISLLAYNDSGDVNSHIDSIFVLPAMKPDFVSDNQCEGEATLFYDSTTNVNINSWYWNFGDSIIAAIQNPTHQYGDTGVYDVKLVLQDVNGCFDSIIKPIRIYLKPFPDFTYPDSICSNDSIQFINSSTYNLDTIIAWHWEFGSGDTSALKDPVYLFDSAGTNIVILTVTGISGCDTSTSDTINVLGGPFVDFGYTNICIGDTVIFLDSTTGTGLFSWYWDFGDSFTSDSMNPVHYYDTTGDYFVTLAVRNAIGCKNTLTKQVKIAALPIANFYDTLPCSDVPVTFFDLSDTGDGNIVGWKWNFGDSDTSTLQNPSHTYAAGGDYVVTLIVTTNYSCMDTFSDSLSVLQSPVPDFTFVSKCISDTIFFFDSTDATLSAPIDSTGYFWDFGDTSVSYQKNPIHPFADTGIFYVTLTVRDDSGCSPSVTKPVLVYDKPKVDFGYSDTNCVNAPVQFFDSSIVIYDSIAGWQWDFAGLGSSTVQNPAFLFPNTFQFQVTLIAVSNRGCVDTSSKTILIHGIPDANFKFEPQYGAPPLDVNFTNLSSADVVCYLWDFGDNSSKDTSFSPSHQYTDTNTYNVILIACNIYGCTDTIIKEIKVMPPVLDAQVIWVCYTEDGDYLSIETRILNSGTRVINSLDLILEIGGSLVVKEKWTGTLKAGEVLYYNFAAQVLKSLTSELPYFCVIADNPNNETDEIPGNNRQCELCTLLVDDFTVLPLRPNPAKDQVKISFILPYKEDIIISLFDILGKEITNFIPENINKGYNELIIDVTYLVKGVYILHYDFDNKIFNQKLIRN
ncbi:MAG: PKD domain-containing protein [Cytophagales bacterium]|nr:PKD domain-containing protein [Cytophagales bacterium]